MAARGWRWHTASYKSLLAFRTREDLLRNVFEVSGRYTLKVVTVENPDGTEEVVTRDDYVNAH